MQAGVPTIYGVTRCDNALTSSLRIHWPCALLTGVTSHAQHALLVVNERQIAQCVATSIPTSPSSTHDTARGHVPNASALCASPRNAVDLVCCHCPLCIPRAVFRLCSTQGISTSSSMQSLATACALSRLMIARCTAALLVLQRLTQGPVLMRRLTVSPTRCSPWASTRHRPPAQRAATTSLRCYILSASSECMASHQSWIRNAAFLLRLWRI